MKEEKCFYAGSFDPMTKGHMAIAFKALEKYNNITLGIGINPDKSNSRLFSPEAAKQIIEKTLINIVSIYDISKTFFLNNPYSSFIDNDVIERIKSNPKIIDVVIYDGLAIDAALKNKATVLIRGIRDSKDAESEDAMAHLNEKLAKTRRAHIRTDQIKTPTNDLTYVSSSLTKSFFSMQEYIAARNYLPETVYREMLSNYLRKDFNTLAEESGVKNSDNIFNRIMQESSTSYKKIPNIAYCLNRLSIQNNSLEGELDSLSELKMSVYYDDESIHNMKSDLQDSNLDIDKIEKYILAANSFGIDSQEKKSFNEQLISDISLAILGEEEELYNMYAIYNRKEHESQSDIKYAEERISILNTLIQKDVLFQTSFFQKHFTKKAKMNMIKERSGMNTFLNNISFKDSLETTIENNYE